MFWTVETNAHLAMQDSREETVGGVHTRGAANRTVLGACSLIITQAWRNTIDTMHTGCSYAGTNAHSHVPCRHPTAPTLPQRQTSSNIQQRFLLQLQLQNHFRSQQKCITLTTVHMTCAATSVQPSVTPEKTLTNLKPIPKLASSSTHLRNVPGQFTGPGKTRHHPGRCSSCILNGRCPGWSCGSAVQPIAAPPQAPGS